MKLNQLVNILLLIEVDVIDIYIGIVLRTHSFLLNYFSFFRCSFF